MLYSPKRCVFVHVQRTGGTTMRQLLEASMKTEELLGYHDHALAASKLGPWLEPGVFRFAFVRNPWSRLVSWYLMLSKATHEFARYVQRESDSFESFLVNCTETIQDYNGLKSQMFSQIDYVADANGRILVDFVGRFEDMETDSALVYRRLGIDGSSRLATYGGTTPAGKHYSEFYTPGMRDLVGERHARDLAAFGYRFT